jgi:hypothetical protein
MLRLDKNDTDAQSRLIPNILVGFDKIDPM